LIFDLLSNEYGWTTKQILSITMKELDWRLRAITKRSENNIRLEASLHGCELNLPSAEAAVDKPTQEQDEAMQAALKRAQERKRHGR
jgi:hypothetical protein